MRHWLILLLLMAAAGNLHSQSLIEKQALNNLEKGKWVRARTQLQKALAKDTLNVIAQYTMALYFFKTENPNFHIDSAHHYASLASKHWTLLSGRDRERARRFPVDSLIILALRHGIDSAAFERAKLVNSEEGYNLFLQRHASSIFVSQAIARRDEVAYLDALKTNTAAGFRSFLNKYPNSQRSDDASRKYHQRLFEEETENKKLESYAKFLASYPDSPYRHVAERYILEITTASGSINSFIQFIHQYHGSNAAKSALNILYHRLLEEQAYNEQLSELLTDSLYNIHQLNKGYLVPIVETGLYGFVDRNGRKVLPPSAADIPDSYICGNITEDVLVLGHSLVARDGTVIWDGGVEDVDDLGYGFLEVVNGSCITVLHKSGFVVGDPCVTDVKMMGGKFIAARKGNAWSVYTLLGRRLLGLYMDDIAYFNDVLAINQQGKWRMVTAEQLGKLADQADIKLSTKFDDVKAVANGLILVRRDSKFGLLDQNLHTKVAMGDHKIEPAFFGAVIGKDSAVQLFKSGEGIIADTFHRVFVNKPFIAVSKERAWYLYDINNMRITTPSYDSVSFAGVFAVGHIKDSSHVYLDGANFLSFHKASFSFIPGRDSVFFLAVHEGTRKTLYDRQGNKLFACSCETVQYLENGLFVFASKGKKGIIGEQGKVLLHPDFDAVGNLEEGAIPLLKEAKFGLYDPVLKKTVRPAYDKNLRRYNDQLLVAYKDGYFGFVNWENKVVNKFQFDEVRYWSDSLAWVRNDMLWSLWHLDKKEAVLTDIKDYRLIVDTAEEKVGMLHRSGEYGVISNRRGLILPLSFNDIVNVGSSDHPLYFTEKHVAEASAFVVVYFDENGKQLFRQLLDGNDYDKIFCRDK